MDIKVREITRQYEDVKKKIINQTTIPFWMSAKCCDLCLFEFDENKNEQIICFQTDDNKKYMAHNSCFMKNIKEIKK